eukprot:6483674-Amphidinium_carterae.1
MKTADISVDTLVWLLLAAIPSHAPRKLEKVHGCPVPRGRQAHWNAVFLRMDLCLSSCLLEAKCKDCPLKLRHS